MIKRLKRNTKREAPVKEVVAPKMDKEPRRPRAGVFTRFRKSETKKTTGNFWKQRKDPVPSHGVVLFKSNNEEVKVVTAPTEQTNDMMMLRASSIATAEMTIPTDGSMGATTNADSASSYLQEGEASFFQATETLVETKEVLISTEDGQIETQRQECIVSGMHRLNDFEDADADDVASESQQPFDCSPEESVTETPVCVPEEEEEEQPFDFQFDAAEIEISSAVVDEEEIVEEDDIFSHSVGSQSGSSHSSDGSFDDDDDEADLEESGSPADVLSASTHGEEDEGKEDEEDIFSDVDDDEEEESLPQAEKGVAFLQSLFLSDLPDDDDDESSFPEEIDLEYEQNRSPFGSALDAIEDFAAESIYSASLLFMAPAELDERRMLKKMSSKKQIVRDEAAEEVLSV